MKTLGYDLHARPKSIAMLNTETGEFTEKTFSKPRPPRQSKGPATATAADTEAELLQAKSNQCAKPAFDNKVQQMCLPLTVFVSVSSRSSFFLPPSVRLLC
jgi:hypothetical protein